ncbi:response regulator transcription factor [Rhodococcus aerolatus]
MGRPSTATRTPGPTTVLVVSHDPAVRVDTTARHHGATVIEAASAGEAALCTRLHGPGALALVDLSLPDPLTDGLVATLRRAGWEVVLVLVPPDGTAAALRALAAGAQGVLVTTADRLPDATPLRRRGDEPCSAVLTGRERAVLALVAGGAGNREVARRIGVSPLTVKAHLARVAGKLGTGDRAEMVLLALRAGLIG